MGKITTYILMMSGLVLLFYFAGVVEPTNPLFKLVFSPETMTLSDIYLTVIGGIATGLAVITVGFITKSLELAAMTAVVPAVLAVLWGFIDVYNALAGVNRVIATLIFGPILLLFILSMIDWWRGRDL